MRNKITSLILFLLSAVSPMVAVTPALGETDDEPFNQYEYEEWDAKKRVRVLLNCAATARELTFTSPDLSKEEIDVIASMPKLEHLGLCLEDPDADALNRFHALPSLREIALKLQSKEVTTTVPAKPARNQEQPGSNLLSKTNNAKLCNLGFEKFPLISSFALKSFDYAFNIESLLPCREHLSNLRLHPTELQGTEYLNQFPSLRSLQIGIGNRGPLTKLISNLCNCKSIEELDLSCNELSHEDLENISKLKTLKHLTIGFPIKLKDEDLFFLSALPNLTSLSIQDSELSDEAMKQLGTLHHLKSLSLRGQFRGIGLARLADLPELEDICIESRKLDKSAYDAIGRLQHLKSISIMNRAPEIETLKPLRQLPHLESFEISLPYEGADEWLKVNGPFSNLKCCVSTWRSDISSEGFKVLGQFKQLEKLILAGSRFRDDDVPSMAELSKLKNLDLQRSHVTSKGILLLPALSALESLDLQRTKIDETAVPKIVSFCNLKDLDLSSTKISSGEQLSRLAKLPKLRKLSLSYTKIGNSDLQYLTGCSASILDLSGTCITVDGLDSLKGMSNLKELGLENCAILNESLAQSKLPGIELSGIPKEVPDQEGPPWVQPKAAKKELETLNREIEKDENDWGLKTQRAATYMALGKFREAAQEYDDLGIAVRSWSCGTFQRFLNEVDFGCFCNRALCHLALGNYEKALNDADTALSINHYSAWARKLRGLAYLKLGDNERAMTDLTFAIELSPKTAAPYHYRAELFRLAGNKEKAEEDEMTAKKLGYADEFKPPIYTY